MLFYCLWVLFYCLWVLFYCLCPSGVSSRNYCITSLSTLRLRIHSVYIPGLKFYIYVRRAFRLQKTHQWRSNQKMLIRPNKVRIRSWRAWEVEYHNSLKSYMTKIVFFFLQNECCSFRTMQLPSNKNLPPLNSTIVLKVALNTNQSINLCSSYVFQWNFINNNFWPIEKKIRSLGKDTWTLSSFDLLMTSISFDC